MLPKRSVIRAGRSEIVGRLAVVGDFIGGGLATALSLTECRSGQPGIVAAAVSNPVVDWVSLDYEIKLERRSVMAASTLVQAEAGDMTVDALLNLRSQLFTKPSHYFDPFASPILFFRSAGAEVPPPPSDASTDDMEQLSILEREEIYRQEVAVPYDAQGPSLNSDTTIVQGRKASRRFPGKSLGLRLPSFNISATTGTPLASQTGDLAHHLRQSFVRQRKNAVLATSTFGRKVLVEGEEDQLTGVEKAVLEAGKADASKNVQLHLRNEASMCSEGRALQIVDWLKQVQIGNP
jgi:acetyl esterase/lipase